MNRIFAKRPTKTPPEATRSEVWLLSIVILILALLLGITVRWNFIAGSDFPINDGGLFHALISDLIDNNFRMPTMSSYNADGIPNSYPPLAFYLVGGLKMITGIPVLEWLRYLPFALSVLTIPVFYYVSKVFFPGDFLARAIATYLFATLPRSFEWFVMGGGITRSLGFIFALSATVFYAKAAQENKIGFALVVAGILGCFTVLSHPVAGIFLAFSVLVLTFYFRPLKINVLVLFGGDHDGRVLGARRLIRWNSDVDIDLCSVCSVCPVEVDDRDVVVGVVEVLP